MIIYVVLVKAGFIDSSIAFILQRSVFSHLWYGKDHDVIMSQSLVNKLRS